MSHLEERGEKNCLNCNAEVHGRFCHVCGQENVKPEETAWHLITHFFNDITHFDGKFFSSLKYLIVKPGYLSLEYKAGRRADYLNPVRMYIFTSAIFFLAFFSFAHVEDKINRRSINGKDERLINAMDSTTFSNFTKELNNGKPMTRDQFDHYVDSTSRTVGIHFTYSRYKSRAEYDSVLHSGKKDHNWFQRQLIYKEIELNTKFKNDQQAMLKLFVSRLMHSFPQMLFISLPLFALLLKGLYFRRRQFYYASHAIFSVHLYVLAFIMMLFVILLRELREVSGWGIISYLNALIFIYIFYYQFRAMRIFYGQGFWKTLLKFLLINFLMFIVIMVLFVFFMFFSLFKI